MCLADIQGDVELLKTVALKNKANFESLLTWKGEAFEERTSTRGDWYEFMIKNKCTFAYDQLGDAVRWNKEPQEGRCIKNGEPRPDILGTSKNYNSKMLKDRTYFEYSGFEQPNDKSKVDYDLVIGEPAMAKGEQDHCLDPRYFLTYTGGITIHRRLMLLYNHANDKTEVGRSVKREGDLVILQFSPDETKMSREVYDLSAGGNMVEYYSKTPTVEITKNYTYEEKSGVWILKSFKKKNINHRKDGEVSKWTRTINWTNSVVNVPFEEDEFTVEKLGLKQGDRISDHKIGMVYIYGGFLQDSQMLNELDKTDMPKETVVPENVEEIIEEVNEADAAAEIEVAHETDTVAENLIHQTLATEGTHTYIYIIVVSFVIGLAGIAYMLNRRFRKE